MGAASATGLGGLGGRRRLRLGRDGRGFGLDSLAAARALRRRLGFRFGGGGHRGSLDGDRLGLAAARALRRRLGGRLGLDRFDRLGGFARLVALGFGGLGAALARRGTTPPAATTAAAALAVRFALGSSLGALAALGLGRSFVLGFLAERLAGLGTGIALARATAAAAAATAALAALGFGFAFAHVARFAGRTRLARLARRFLRFLFLDFLFVDFVQLVVLELDRAAMRRADRRRPAASTDMRAPSSSPSEAISIITP